jgi:hypothetical protein
MASESVSLDLTPYKCVYISYGSKSYDGSSFQECPEFLKHLNTFPLICISIDAEFPSFNTEELEMTTIWDQVRPYTNVHIPTSSVKETIAITQQLLKQIDQLTINSKHVFFVNFIKFRTLNKLEDIILQETEELPLVIPSKYNYYDWCGFDMPDFIQIRNKKLDFLLRSIESEKLSEFIIALKDDTELEDFCSKYKGNYEKGIVMYNLVRDGLLDITNLTNRQSQTLELTDAKLSGGNRRFKRVRRYRTRRKSTKRHVKYTLTHKKLKY